MICFSSWTDLKNPDQEVWAKIYKPAKLVIFGFPADDTQDDGTLYRLYSVICSQ